MSCEHLVCAACAGPVVEGRCAICRAARADVHVATPFGLSPQLLVLVLAVVALVTVLLVQMH